MARSYTQIFAMNGGAITPRMFGRADLGAYYNSVAQMLNFKPLAHGGAITRGGTRFVAETKDSLKASRLIEFEPSVAATYVLEVGDQYIRFVRDGAQIDVGTPPAFNIGTTYGMGELVSEGGVNYWSKTDGNVGNTPPNATYWSPLVGSIMEIPTTWAEVDIDDIRVVQSVDVMWMVHPDYPVQRLERFSGDDGWRIFDEILVDGPWQKINTTTTQLTFVAPFVTASSVVGINGGVGWLPSDVGRQIRIFEAGIWYPLTIQSISSSVTVVTNGAGSLASTTTWKLGAFSDTTGYPRVVTLFEQRLVFASTREEPETVWMSRSGDFTNFGTAATILADDAITFIPADVKLNVVRWLAPTRKLGIGADGSEWAAGGIGDSAVTGNGNNSLRRHTAEGSSNITPVLIGDFVVFVDNTFRKVFNFNWKFETDSFNAEELSRYAEHFLRTNQIVDMAFSRKPDSNLYMVRDDGIMLGTTYVPSEQVNGWFELDTQGLFESVASIFENARSAPYVIVNRTIGGAAKRFIERVEPEFPGGDVADCYMVDSGLTYSGVSTSTISGLDHLEGEDVVGLYDGKAFTPLTVTGGEITLPAAATKVQVGLGYSCDIYTLPVEVVGGATMGILKTIVRAIVKLTDSLNLKMGKDFDNLDLVKFNENQIYGEQNALFSGEKDLDIESSIDSTIQLAIRQDQPLPTTINAIIVEFDTTGGG